MTSTTFCADFTKHRAFDLHYLAADDTAHCEVCSPETRTDIDRRVQDDVEVEVEVMGDVGTLSSPEAIRRVFGRERR